MERQATSIKPQVPRLAGIVYENGPIFDSFAYHLAKDLRARGFRLAGVAQSNQRRQLPGRCDMALEDLTTGRTMLISQDRGVHARGCHLNASALLEASVMIRQQLSKPIHLVLINKFGKLEAEGGGLRDVIAEAYLLGIPTLIGTPLRNLSAWQDFNDGGACQLSPCNVEIDQWLKSFFWADIESRKRLFMSDG